MQTLSVHENGALRQGECV